MAKSTLENFRMSPDMILKSRELGFIENKHKRTNSQTPMEREWKEHYNSFNEKQRAIFDHHYIGGNMVVKGVKGAGKTHFLKAMTFFLRYKMGKNVLVLAPTKASAAEIGGQTVHSAFHFSFDSQIRKNGKPFVKPMDILEDINAIVVDDCSKLRVDYFDSICATIQRINSNIQLVIAGDFDNEFPILEEVMREKLKKDYGKEISTGSPTEGIMWNSCKFEEWTL